MNKRHYEHTLPNIRGSLSNTYDKIISRLFMDKYLEYINDMLRCNKENRNGRLKLAIC